MTLCKDEDPVYHVLTRDQISQGGDVQTQGKVIVFLSDSANTLSYYVSLGLELMYIHNH